MFEGFITDRTFPRVLRAFVVALLVLFAGGGAIFIERSYIQAKEMGEATAQNGAAQVSTYLSDLIADVGRILLALPAPGAQSGANLADVSREISAVVRDREFALGAIVLDRQGKVIAESAPGAFNAMGITDREFFDIHRTAISPLLRDQILVTSATRDPSEGKSNIVVSKRINDPGGGFAGVALMCLDGEALIEALQAASGDPKITLAIVDGAGRLLLSVPRAPPFQTHYPAFESRYNTFSAESSGVVSATIDPLDGESRVIGYRYEPKYRITVFAGVSRTRIYSALSWQVPTIIVAFMLVAGTVLILVQLMLKQFTALVSREQSVAVAEHALRYTTEFVAWVQPGGKLRWINEAYRHALGYEIYEAKGLNAWDLNPDLDRHTWSEFWTRLREVGTEDREVRNLRKDGSIIEIDAKVSRVEFRNEAIAFILAHDVTERNRTARALRDERNRFERYAGLSTDIIWEMDAQFCFTYFVSPGLPGLDGIATGKRPWELPYTGIEAEQWGVLEQTMRRGDPFRDFRYAIVLDDGSVRWVSSSGVPLKNDEGKLTGYLGITRDISEERDAQQREKAQLAAFADHREFVSIGMMSATILHNLKHEIAHAMLRADIAANEVRKEGPLSKQKMESHLAQLSQSFDRTVSMLDEVKSALQSDESRKKATVLLQDSAKQVQFIKAEVISQARANLETRGLELGVVAVPEDVVHVLFNLVQNAADALVAARVERPVIRVSARTLDEHWVEVIVEDNGPGFGANGKAGSSTHKTGAGIGGWGRGLEICRWLISSYDGAKFWTENAPAGGAAAHFTLPAAGK